jgi:diaminopimelate epimerase
MGRESAQEAARLPANSAPFSGLPQRAKRPTIPPRDGRMAGRRMFGEGGCMRFTKMHGLGNDYVYVDCFSAPPPDDPADLARRIADRHFGVGGDGLILVLPADAGVDAHVRMRMFNADGTESEMCGNGIRCVCKFAYDRGLCRAHPMRIQTGAGVLSLEYTVGPGDRVSAVTVDMGRPALEAERIPVSLPGVRGASRVVDAPLDRLGAVPGPNGWLERCGLDPRLTCVSLGNPHAVLFCRDVRAVPLEVVGPWMERHPAFPRRVNMHVVQVDGPREVTMRTWERGAGITLGCGTGASAVCVAGAVSGRTAPDVLVHLPGGDLTLRWEGASQDVLMSGPAVEVFTGIWPE